MVISLDGEGTVNRVMAEAPHGTAPALEGKNVANPMAMILAAAGMLANLGAAEADRASRAIYESTLEAVFEGHRTSDLAGTATTSGFTDEVIRRVKSKIEVWRTMG